MGWNMGLKAALALGPAAALSLASCATAQDKQEAPKAEQELAAKEKSEKSSSVKIISKSENGEESVELWIDGEKTDAKTQEDVERILKERGIDNVYINLSDDGREMKEMRHKMMIELPEMEGLARLHEMPEWKELEGLGNMRIEIPREGQAWAFAAPEDMTPPKSMLGVRLNPASEELRGYLGLGPEEGVLVAGIVDGSPAASIDLKPNDLIVGVIVNGGERQKVNDASLRKLIAESEPGTKVEIHYLRAGRPMSANATLEAFKSDAFGMAAPGAPGEVRIVRPGQGGDLFVPRLRGTMDDRTREEVMRSIEKQLEETKAMLEQLQKEQEKESNDR